MNGITISPMMGWPVGISIALIMTAVAVANVIIYIRTRRNSDGTLAGCIRRTLLALLVAAMALTPSIVTETTSRAVNATDVVVAVDVTGSMAVSDAHYGSSSTIPRIDAAKQAVNDLTTMYPNASFAAIRFGASGTLDVPLTPDTLAIRGWANTLAVESTALSTGSNLDAPLDQLLVTLKAVRESHPDDTVIVYLVTDGEQTSSGNRRTFSSLRQYLNDAFTLGVGSTQGGKIPVVSADAKANATDGPWVEDPSTGKPGISTMNPNNLRDIADEMNGRSVLMDTGHTAADAMSDKASKSWRTTETTKRRERVSPVIWPLAIVAALLLTWELGAWIVSSRRML